MARSLIPQFRLPRARWIALATLVLVLAGCALLIWLPAHRENRAIAALRANGREVETASRPPQRLREFYARSDDPFGDNPVDHLSFLNRVQLLRPYGFTDADAVHLQAFQELYNLVLTGQPVTDVTLAHVRDLVELRHLRLGGTLVSDTGLAHLSGMEHLVRLDLAGTQIGDAGLAHVRGLTKLRQLSLASTKITDAGLSQLSALSELVMLTLDDTSVGDTGIMQLSNLSKLRELSVIGTHVTDAGIDAMLQVLPECEIVFKRPLPE